MSYWKELDAAIATILDFHGNIGVFQCTTSYPCPAEKIGLNVISDIKDRYGSPSGLSDHSGTNHLFQIHSVLMQLPLFCHQILT